MSLLHGSQTSEYGICFCEWLCKKAAIPGSPDVHHGKELSELNIDVPDSFQDKPFLGFQMTNPMQHADLLPPDIVKIQDYCRKFYQEVFK